MARLYTISSLPHPVPRAPIRRSRAAALDVRRTRRSDARASAHPAERMLFSLGCCAQVRVTVINREMSISITVLET